MHFIYPSLNLLFDEPMLIALVAFGNKFPDRITFEKAAFDDDVSIFPAKLDAVTARFEANTAVSRTS